MKYAFLLLFLLGFITTSCQKNAANEIQKENAAIGDSTALSIKQARPAATSNNELAKQIDCEAYFKLNYVSDSLKAFYIAQLIAQHNSALSLNTKQFLLQLQDELLNPMKYSDQLAFTKVLAPVFNLEANQLSIITFPNYVQAQDSFQDISAESDLVKLTSSAKQNNNEEPSLEKGKLIYYPQILDSILKAGKPLVYVYSTKGVKSTCIKDFGFNAGECSESYHYLLDTRNFTTQDKNLFASKYKLDLIFENNPEIDRLMRNQVVKECEDCPSSSHLVKTFARLKGTDNVYFTYADTFPLNNELDTPSRGLILRTKENKIVNLWYKEVDLFGCSCL
ncbi:hypothetical protein [Adhaeribacter aquaticus]|uniref:hypothetical protein n=1 Tax=Adhaeribacter aquaticus TaxID=299567 RepID=UPI00042914FF|nr:hypothetical protein [Adhaeribacter aquaticus]